MPSVLFPNIEHIYFPYLPLSNIPEPEPNAQTAGRVTCIFCQPDTQKPMPPLIPNKKAPNRHFSSFLLLTRLVSDRLIELRVLIDPYNQAYIYDLS